MTDRDVVGRAMVSKWDVFVGGCGGRGTGSRTTFYPCHGAVKSSNTQCCMREGTQLAARGEADPSNFRFRISGSPGHYAVASTHGHKPFDVVCPNRSPFWFAALPVATSLGGKEGGG